MTTSTRGERYALKQMLMLLLAASTLPGCKDEGVRPPGPQRAMELSVVDYGTTDAWLQVRFTDAPPYAFTIVRDGQAVLTAVSSPAETLVADETLLPNRSYTYKAYRLSGTGAVDSTDGLQLTTLDTTSSAWHWALDTLGVMNSYLLDCAVIAPDNIWVVGEMYVDEVRYNAANWNGARWEMKRIPFVGPCSNVNYPPITAIWAFSATNILLTNGGAVVRYDGTNAVLDCSMNELLSGTLNRIYARTPQDVYAVGGAGTIVRFNGTAWQRQESGTTLSLSGVSGVSANEVYAIGNNRAFGRAVVLKSSGLAWETMIVSEGEDTTGVFRTRLFGGLEDLWVDERGTVYAVGGLMFQYKRGRWDYVRSLAGNCVYCNPGALHRGYLYGMAGRASNDVLIVGEINTLRHYNGVTWTPIGLPYHPLKPELFWYSCDIKNNQAVAVGKLSLNVNRGTVIRAWR